MRIDDRVEGLVRESLAAVIAADPGRMTVAGQAVLDAGEQTLDEASDLLFALNDRLLADLHDGPVRPDSVAALAEAVARMEAWTGLDSSVAWQFLMALAQGRDPSEALPPDEAVSTGLVVGGWLLSAFTPAGQHWESVLDECLDCLENNVLQGSFAS
ncbi:hypothetical protein LWF15_07830 [Kineosporia rhizophila]|uniref:hypothetical protein n=1 Tax=Kineosporia TaxID=49184 RepID=UPI001E2FFD25|nr:MULTISPECIES: hypothetical protein [Kineosporia]MCE0535416.1 hypothetical protein [Kineosporia rhizophila]GLY16802.1 hypothetical protein Kisp01_38170 [Kineosporia sp. NBRC 101677]